MKVPDKAKVQWAVDYPMKTKDTWRMVAKSYLWDGFTLDMVGEALGISRARVSQVLVRFVREVDRQAAKDSLARSLWNPQPRPIDVDAPAERDVWQTWTPELQAAEFARRRHATIAAVSRHYLNRLKPKGALAS